MASLAQAVPRNDLSLPDRYGLVIGGEEVTPTDRFAVPSGQPLGGVKRSGFGREMCAETLLEYSAAKAVSMSLDTARPGLWGASA